MKRRRVSWRAALVLLAAAACTRKTPEPTADDGAREAGAGSAASAVTAKADAGSAATTGAPTTPAPDGGAAPPQITTASRKTALRAFDEGRTLSRARDFKGALLAFDRALALDPGDARVLAEVGYAALQDKQLERAEDACKKALLYTQDATLRAQILYNQGRTLEAKGQKSLARSSYQQSLDLRANEEVKRRLAGVTAPAGGPSMEPRLPCREDFKDVAEACACLLAEKTEYLMMGGGAGNHPWKPGCGEEDNVPSLGDPRLLVVHWFVGGFGGETAYVLAARDGARVQLLADLGHDYEPGAMGIHNSATVLGGEPRTVDGRRVVVVRSQQGHSDYNMGGLELCYETTKRQTVCALGLDGGVSRCTPPLPVRVDTGCGPGVEPAPHELDDDTRRWMAEIKARTTKVSAETSWSIAPDGSVTVKVLAGSSADAVPRSALGPHPLF
jgi:tetratricopeptide (TPR) repeat protein